jgi:phage terminase large subunit
MEERRERMEIDLTNLPKIINPVYFPLLKNKDRYLALMGGGGSGKSVFATQ